MKTIRIKVNASGDQTNEIIDAGVMFEHNNTTLEFEVDRELISEENKYYIEFATPSGTYRSDYLPIDENRVVSFLIPETITSQMCVNCYFNIARIDTDTLATTLLIKPKAVKLSFSTVEGDSSTVGGNYEFSVNALLEAVHQNKFKGERGEKGERGNKGEKGEKGDKGEPGVNGKNGVDGKDAVISENCIDTAHIKDGAITQNKLASDINFKNERLIYSAVVGNDESVEEFNVVKDVNGNGFALKNVKIYLVGKHSSDYSAVTVKFRTDYGGRYLTLASNMPSSGELYLASETEVLEGMFIKTVFTGGKGKQGTSSDNVKSYTASVSGDPIVNLQIGFYQGTGQVHIPFTAGTKLLITGVDA